MGEYIPTPEDKRVTVCGCPLVECLAGTPWRYLTPKCVKDGTVHPQHFNRKTSYGNP